MVAAVPFDMVVVESVDLDSVAVVVAVADCEADAETSDLAEERTELREEAILEALRVVLVVGICMGKGRDG
jgi:hypothetical protein